MAEKDFQLFLILVEHTQGNPVPFQYFIASRTGQMFLNEKDWLANFYLINKFLKQINEKGLNVFLRLKKLILFCLGSSFLTHMQRKIG